MKAEEYTGLVVFKTQGEAERFFLMAITDKRGAMWKFPRDYQLYELGGVDVKTGVVERAPVPRDVTPYSAVDSFISWVKLFDSATVKLEA